MRSSRILVPALAAGALLASGAPAHAAGSLSVSPAVVEHVATAGTVGSITVANTTSAALKVTVTPRPWLQSRATGVVTADRRRTLAGVTVGARSFTLAAGANRAVAVTLRKVPGAGSVYGAIDVVGLPTKKPKNGIVAGYRLVPSLRLNPTAARRKLAVQAGLPRLAGSGSARVIAIAAKSTGNTIEPISGTATITGAQGTRSVTLAARRILPGAIVDLRLTRTAGLARGTYRVTTVLKQGGRTVVNSRRSVKVT